MSEPHAPPPSSTKLPVSRADLVRRRKFWLRVVWIGVAGVLVPPLFGLIGTVVGMVGAFETLAENGQADPEELSGDISIALLTTMWGLVVSAVAVLVLIPALIRFFTLPKPDREGSGGE